ncbi:MAG TPA: 50S ribosomal protein L11 methyltransferase [bacterium]|nr:50S ribosomal protein L11 methyltransferase [bacterium]
MKWLEITVTTAPPAAPAVADILFGSRSPGIEELSAGAETTRLRAYLPVGPTTAVTVDAIRARIAALPGFGLDVGPAAIEAAEVDDEGWADAWKMHFRPFAVGRRLWITPTWDRTPPPAGAVVVELDPGMAFGSGLHPSTQMCLEVLDERLRPGDAVVDVGAGSGILSIAAAKLGASRVLAIDADPVAVAVARANVAHNGLAALVRVQEGDLLAGVQDAADMLVANLTADLHLTFLPTVRPHLGPGGVLAASGITEHREHKVAEAARVAGLAPVQTLRSGEWRCLVLAAAG